MLSPEEAFKISVEILGIDKVSELGNKDAGLCIAIGEIQKATAEAQEAETLEKIKIFHDKRGSYPECHRTSCGCDVIRLGQCGHRIITNTCPAWINSKNNEANNVEV